jgi:hypothetical protein
MVRAQMYGRLKKTLVDVNILKGLLGKKLLYLINHQLLCNEILILLNNYKTNESKQP